MDFNFNNKAHCDFDFHYFYCAILEDTIDVEMTIQMVEGIHTYMRYQTTQMSAYSSWGRQVKPFSSLHKKIADYEEEKRRSQENKSSNPFTPVREDKSGQKRSRKYRQLGMGHSLLSTVVSMHSTKLLPPLQLPCLPLFPLACLHLSCLAHLVHPIHYPHPSHRCKGPLSGHG